LGRVTAGKSRVQPQELVFRLSLSGVIFVPTGNRAHASRTSSSHLRTKDATRLDPCSIRAVQTCQRRQTRMGLALQGSDKKVPAPLASCIANGDLATNIGTHTAATACRSGSVHWPVPVSDPADLTPSLRSRPSSACCCGVSPWHLSVPSALVVTDTVTGW
jgi:hypothetical protein